MGEEERGDEGSREERRGAERRAGEWIGEEGREPTNIHKCTPVDSISWLEIEQRMQRPTLPSHHMHRHAMSMRN